MSFDNVSNFNDEDLFLGKLTLNEIKYRFRQNTERNSTSGCSFDTDSDEDSSLKLIETTSEPSIIHINESSIIQHCVEDSVIDVSLNDSKIQSWNTRNSDESFINMEHMVAKMCQAEQDECGKESKNTSDEVGRPQKFPPIQKCEGLVGTVFPTDCDINKEIKNENNYILEHNAPEILIHSSKTPTKEREMESDIFYTPLKSTENLNSNNVFKTPANPSARKVLKGSVKKTPMKYDYIKSPVASYIRDSPHVPLVKDIKPKKPLPTGSSIPKLVKAPSSLVKNKENMDLPRLAYRSAKATKTNEIAGSSHLPKSQWAKNVESSLPRPMVTKHEVQRFKTKVIVTNEDSFGNLSLHQADVSVCTLKPGTPLKYKK